MNTHSHSFQVVTGTSNYELAKTIAGHTNYPLINIEISRFINGEKRVRITGDIVSKHVAIVQSLSSPSEEYIIELLLIIDALKRMGIQYIHLLIPWCAYSLQDKVFRYGEALSAHVLAQILSSFPIQSLHFVELHNPSILGYFHAPAFNLDPAELFVTYLKENFSQDNFVVVSPDHGASKRAHYFAGLLNSPVIHIGKIRELDSGEIKSYPLYKDLTFQKAVIYDDGVLSGETLYNACELLKTHGVTDLVVCAVHAHNLTVPGRFREKLLSVTNKIILSNTIDCRDPYFPKATIDVSTLLYDSLVKFIHYS